MELGAEWCRVSIHQEISYKISDINYHSIKWAHGSFAACCRKSGKHTHSNEDYDWNVQLTNPACAKLTPLWKEAMKDLGSLADVLSADIDTSIEEICEPLRR